MYIYTCPEDRERRKKPWPILRIIAARWQRGDPQVIRSRQFHSSNLFLSRRHCCNLLLFYAIRFAARRRTTSPILVFVFLFSYRSRARAARSEWGSKSSLRASRTKWRPVSRKPFAGCRSIPAALPCSFPEYAIDNWPPPRWGRNGRSIMIHADTFNYSAVHRVCTSNVSLWCRYASTILARVNLDRLLRLLKF